jgi:hypothetical protein
VQNKSRIVERSRSLNVLDPVEGLSEHPNRFAILRIQLAMLPKYGDCFRELPFIAQSACLRNW